MQRVVWLRMEYRDNKAMPIKTLERLCILEDEGSPQTLADLLEKWASETALAMATTISMSKQDVRQLRHNVVKNLIK